MLLHVVDEDGVLLQHWLGGTLGVVVRKAALGVLLARQRTHLVVLGVQPATDARLLGCVARVDLLVLLIDHVFLELGIVLLSLLQEDLLAVLSRLGFIVIRVRIHVLDRQWLLS